MFTLWTRPIKLWRVDYETDYREYKGFHITLKQVCKRKGFNYNDAEAYVYINSGTMSCMGRDKRYKIK